MNMKQLVLAAALGSVALGASATQTEVTSLPFTGSYSSGSVGGVKFNNEYDFSLTSASVLDTTLSPLGATGSASLYSIDYSTGPTLVDKISLGTAGSTFTSLAAGDYFYKLLGTTAADTGGYTLKLTVSAVPEPANIAMLLAGLGMMGFVARRRKN